MTYQELGSKAWEELRQQKEERHSQYGANDIVPMIQLLSERYGITDARLKAEATVAVYEKMAECVGLADWHTEDEWNGR